jgi:hypothetical protein
VGSRLEPGVRGSDRSGRQASTLQRRCSSSYIDVDLETGREPDQRVRANVAARP